MICKQCFKQYKLPDGKKIKIRYAYNKYCSKHCDYVARKGYIPKKNVTIAGAQIHEDILQCSQLRAEQKLAMTVLKLAKQDIEVFMPKWPQLVYEHKLALASALKLMFCDSQSLVFWCNIAGWDAEAVQEQSLKLVTGVDWKPMLRAHGKWELIRKEH